MKYIFKILIISFLFVNMGFSQNNSGKIKSSLYAKFPNVNAPIIAFIEDVSGDIESQSWANFIGKCSNTHIYAQMVEMQIGLEQYILEILQISSRGITINDFKYLNVKKII